MSTAVTKMSEVVRRVGLSRATIYRLIRDNAFPKPVKPDGHVRSIGFWRRDIDAWLAEQAPTRAPTLQRAARVHKPTTAPVPGGAVHIAVMLRMPASQLATMLRCPDVELMDVSAA